MPYKHILAAVDLSDEAAQVIVKARATADSHGAKLSLISIVKPLTQVYGGLNMETIANGSLSFEKDRWQPVCVCIPRLPPVSSVLNQITSIRASSCSQVPQPAPLCMATYIGFS